MRVRTAERLAQCYRTGKEGDSRIQRAVRQTQRDDTSKLQLAEKIEFDDRMAAIIARVPAPPAVRERLATLVAEPPKEDWRAIFKNPAILSAGLALLVVLALAAFFWWSQMQDFPGRKALVEMLDHAHRTGSVDLEFRGVEAGSLGDRFFLQYNLQHYEVPPEFAHYTTSRAHVFQQDGHPVALVGIDQPAMVLFIFRADYFGVELPGKEWRVFEYEDLAAAVRREGDTCCMVAILGDRRDMRDLLDEIVPPPAD